MRPLPPGLPPDVAQHAINFQHSVQQQQMRPPLSGQQWTPIPAVVLIIRLVLGVVFSIVGLAFLLWFLL